MQTAIADKKGNPIHKSEQLNCPFNLLTLENHKNKLNINLEIQLQGVKLSYSKELTCRNENRQS